MAKKIDAKKFISQLKNKKGYEIHFIGDKRRFNVLFRKDGKFINPPKRKPKNIDKELWERYKYYEKFKDLNKKQINKKTITEPQMPSTKFKIKRAKEKSFQSKLKVPERQIRSYIRYSIILREINELGFNYPEDYLFLRGALALRGNYSFKEMQKLTGFKKAIKTARQKVKTGYYVIEYFGLRYTQYDSITKRIINTKTYNINSFWSI